MLTLPSSVKIYVAATPVDARKSFDGLSALVQSEFGIQPLSGHLFAFINRRGHIAQLLFWDRNGFFLMKKRLEAGTFRLASKPLPEATHVEIAIERERLADFPAAGPGAANLGQSEVEELPELADAGD